jgi:hypothetical protein
LIRELAFGMPAYQMRENSTLEAFSCGWNQFFHRNEYNTF